MKHTTKTIVIKNAVCFFMIYLAMTIQSCSNSNEPSTANPSETIKKEIVGTWIGEYSMDVETQHFTMTSELTFEINGKMIRTVTSSWYSNQVLVGHQSTEFSEGTYDVIDRILVCNGSGEYEIIPAGNKLTLIKKNQSNMLWGNLSHTQNGVSYEICPDSLIYTRK